MPGHRGQIKSSDNVSRSSATRRSSAIYIRETRRSVVAEASPHRFHSWGAQVNDSCDTIPCLVRAGCFVARCCRRGWHSPGPTVEPGTDTSGADPAVVSRATPLGDTSRHDFVGRTGTQTNRGPGRPQILRHSPVLRAHHGNSDQRIESIEHLRRRRPGWRLEVDRWGWHVDPADG